MNALKKVSADQIPTDRITDIVDRLKARNVPISLILDDGLAVIQAHVPSGQAARMLKPLGRKAAGPESRWAILCDARQYGGD